MNGRHGVRLDYAALHHYLAWVHLRSGHRRSAVGHLWRAAVEGAPFDVAQTLSTLGRGRVGKTIPALAPRPSPLQRAWLDEAGAWISRLAQEQLTDSSRLPQEGHSATAGD